MLTVGLHCFNAHNGTNLQFKTVTKVNAQVVSFVLVGSQEEATQWDENAVGGFYTGLMPTWLELNDAIRGTNNEQLHYYYEVKESDVQENEWLHLYAQVAAYSEWDIDMEDHFPLELEKLVVRTKEYVEPSVSKVKCSNAIFYIIFKTCEGLKHSAVIRQTVDGRPGHMSLEVTSAMIDIDNFYNRLYI